MSLSWVSSILLPRVCDSVQMKRRKFQINGIKTHSQSQTQTQTQNHNNNLTSGIIRNLRLSLTFKLASPQTSWLTDPLYSSDLCYSLSSQPSQQQTIQRKKKF
ncbi:hypothetical protein BY996DRAFT_6778018 [Phakopsora pachyrhizi]|nr:hypothetical protein BY996DRAFT_6778018 [Phakopsora pachyrhizi]